MQSENFSENEPLFVDYNRRYFPLRYTNLFVLAWNRGQHLVLGDRIQITDHEEHQDEAEVVIIDYERRLIVVAVAKEMAIPQYI